MKNIITQVESITKWQVVIDPTTSLEGVPDGVYPFQCIGQDQWAVVIDEEQVGWSSQYGIACLIYAEAARVKREHVQRNPANAIPRRWWVVVTDEFTAGVDRSTNEISYADH